VGNQKEASLKEQDVKEIADAIKGMLAHCKDRGIDPGPTLRMVGELAIRAGGYDFAAGSPSHAVRGAAKVTLGAALNAIADAYDKETQQ
jgi:hypothetical protein